jgi:hypothetical protein
MNPDCFLPQRNRLRHEELIRAADQLRFTRNGRTPRRRPLRAVVAAALSALLAPSTSTVETKNGDSHVGKKA